MALLVRHTTSPAHAVRFVTAEPSTKHVTALSVADDEGKRNMTDDCFHQVTNPEVGLWRLALGFDERV